MPVIGLIFPYIFRKGFESLVNSNPKLAGSDLVESKNLHNQNLLVSLLGTTWMLCKANFEHAQSFQESYMLPDHMENGHPFFGFRDIRLGALQGERRRSNQSIIKEDILSPLSIMYCFHKSAKAVIRLGCPNHLQISLDCTALHLLMLFQWSSSRDQKTIKSPAGNFRCAAGRCLSNLRRGHHLRSCNGGS